MSKLNSMREFSSNTLNIVAFGLAIFYAPSFYDLATGIWIAEQQAHGAIVFAVAIWLLSKKWNKLSNEVTQPSKLAGWLIFITGLLFYIIGRSQDILTLEIGSVVWLIIGNLLLLKGTKALNHIWLSIIFFLFCIPLPEAIVNLLTQPMKIAVSHSVENVLYFLGYPISRTGVMIQIGSYQLLVADACAGLHTLFTLEILGLLYLNLFKYESLIRNALLGILILPISFLANVLRVTILCLITYHLGDEAGQGFLHGFAGGVLFLIALILIFSIDHLLRACSKHLTAHC